MVTNPRPAQVSVLLVDDDAAILEAVTDLLQYHGYHVVTARDGQEALSVMQTFLPDMIISDITMPVMDGFQFFDAVRQRTNWTSIPFIFLTSRGQKTDVLYGYTLGVDDYITKPFEPEDLIVKIDLRLKRAREIRAAAESEADRIKNQLLTIFSHELRTPLTYIYGYTSLLRDDRSSLDDATVDQMLGGVQLGAERLVRLVEDLILVVRIDNGIMDMEFERRSGPVALREIVDHIVTMLEAGAAARNVRFEVNIDPSLRVNGLPLYLENALTRLIDNGIRFTKPGGGQIDVSAHPEDGKAIIRITDQGIGIDPADQKRIFERFTQIDREHLEQQGVGLGLAVAKGIIEAHAGNITLESKVGEGTTFVVTLALAQ